MREHHVGCLVVVEETLAARACGSRPDPGAIPIGGGVFKRPAMAVVLLPLAAALAGSGATLRLLSPPTPA